MKSGRHYNVSSGNVFVDLGVDAPEQALAKAELTAKIAQIIEARGLTQAAAAKLLGIDQPKVSALLRGKLTGFSTERLIKFLNALGRDVEIVVRDRPRAKGPGHLQFLFREALVCGKDSLMGD
jgi:predicted XRE-type DNA-binding protein